MANFLPKIFPKSNAQAQYSIRQRLLRREAAIGGQLFGPVPKGHRRDFFCLDEHTWIWHEEWTQHGQRKVVNTRYNVRSNGVVKSQNGQDYQLMSRDEAQNLYRAVSMYRQRVVAEYDRILQAA